MEKEVISKEVLGEIFKAMWIDYDEEADVLYVNLNPSQKATDTEMTEDGIIYFQNLFLED